MNAWVFAWIAIGIGAAACAPNSGELPGAPGAAGAGGSLSGAGGFGPSSSSGSHHPSSSASSGSTSSSGGTSANGGSTTGGSCDAIGVCKDATADSDPTNDCLSCAVAGACDPPRQACVDDASCSALLQCFVDCGSDLTCANDCPNQYPDGVSLYNALVICLVCDNCTTSCADLGVMCP